MSDDRFPKLKSWLAKLIGGAAPSDGGTAAQAKAITPPPAPAVSPASVKPSRASLPERESTLHAKAVASSRTPLADLCLGIDFGTRFTKVAAGSKVLDRREVLALGPDDKRLIASVLHRDASGRFHPPDVPCLAPTATVNYLKMRMADPGSASFDGDDGQCRFSVFEFEALAAFYVAGIIRMSRSAVRLQFGLPPAREIRWSCNVGVPVKHCDGEVVDRFRRMARAAWDWSNSVPEPIDLASLVAAYRARQDLPDVGDVHVAPELTGALAAFGEDPNTAEGLYALFDIGGGTVDGSVFEITKSGRMKLRIIASNVASLGTIAVARHLAGSNGGNIEAIERTLLFSDPTAALSNGAEMAKPLQMLAFQLIARSRQQMGSQLFSAAIYGTSSEKPKYPDLLAPYPDVPLLLSGGGAGSKWYQRHLAATDKHFKVNQYGVGNFKIHVLPRPPDNVVVDYHRFVVALGLANAKLFLADYTLPASKTTVEALPEWTAPHDAPYSKDLI
jgi:hypothetical protein